MPVPPVSSPSPTAPSPQGLDPQTQQQVQQLGEKLGMDPQQIQKLMKLLESLPPEKRKELLDALKNAGGEEGSAPPGGGGGGTPPGGEKKAGEKKDPMQELMQMLQALGIDPKQLGLDNNKSQTNTEQFPGDTPNDAPPQ